MLYIHSNFFCYAIYWCLVISGDTISKVMAKATRNSRFETEKFPLSMKLNYHSLCNTSTLYTACIAYAVFKGHGVLPVLPLFSLVLMLTVKVFACRVHTA